MPIHMTVQVNQDLIHYVHIARIDENMSTDADAVIEYSVVVNPAHPRDSYMAKYAAEKPSWGDWLNGTKFYHRYGDGVLVCVQKALEAYNSSK